MFNFECSNRCSLKSPSILRFFVKPFFPIQQHLKLKTINFKCMFVFYNNCHIMNYHMSNQKLLIYEYEAISQNIIKEL